MTKWRVGFSNGLTVHWIIHEVVPLLEKKSLLFDKSLTNPIAIFWHGFRGRMTWPSFSWWQLYKGKALEAGKRHVTKLGKTKIAF